MTTLLVMVKVRNRRKRSVIKNDAVARTRKERMTMRTNLTTT